MFRRIWIASLVLISTAGLVLGVQPPPPKCPSTTPESEQVTNDLKREIGEAFGEARRVFPWLFLAICTVSMAVLIVVYLTRRPVQLKHVGEDDKLREPDRNENGVYDLGSRKRKKRRGKR